MDREIMMQDRQAPSKMLELGVCYYPEHWPESSWAADAQSMRAMGLTKVRIAEFAWSRMEPAPGDFDWGWLDRAIEVLAAAGLQIVMCTPTSAPPRWLVDAHPEILPVDEYGRARRFGSRRHYCFSSPVFRAESRRITTALGERYGAHPAVVAWQTDNEYGNNDTTISYSPAALAAFRDWLAARYDTIGALNVAWGTVFWSQEYTAFEQIDFPVNTTSEPNPSHSLDFRRFCSDQVIAFNREQVDILRAKSPGRTILHNSMWCFTDYDHHAMARDLDTFAWDSYPLGALSEGFWPEQLKQDAQHRGHPDVAAFNHDLYRGLGHGRFWVMEQQPGPVNWASHNPAPAPGMVRLWTWEAFAHGAELVSYFRWRQAPFAQEQLHTGLQRPDGTPDTGSLEAAEVAVERAELPDSQSRPAPVALVLDYSAQWLFEIQPHGADIDYLELVFTFYGALRRLGVDIDIVAADVALDDYALVIVPSLPIITSAQHEALAHCRGSLLLGPRTGSRTTAMQIPETMPPGTAQSLIDIRVDRVESIRGARPHTVIGNGYQGGIERWREQVSSPLQPEAVDIDGHGTVYRQGHVRYLAAWPDTELCEQLLRGLCDEAGVPVRSMPDGIRRRRRGDLYFVFNYGDRSHYLPWLDDKNLIFGKAELPPAGVAAWQEVAAGESGPTT